MPKPKKVKALVITGYGLNCEAETSHAFKIAGAEASEVHLNDLLAGLRTIDEFEMLAFIGGFSFGDHLGAGTVFATRMKYRMKDALDRFIKSGRLIIGLCNGFQTMVKLGLLPGLDGDYFRRSATLAWNDSGVFRDAWVRLAINPESPCVFTKGIETLDLPVRHGEGKFMTENADVLGRILKGNLVALSYADPATGRPTEEFPHNPNGSALGIAGICDPTGRIFGMMPHPEAHLFGVNNPQWARKGLANSEGAGLRIFRNAVEFVRQHF